MKSIETFPMFCQKHRELTKPQKRIAYKAYLLELGVNELIRQEESKTERTAWKVRSYMANKLRQ